MKHSLLLCVCSAAIVLGVHAQAADWLMLQGTEPPSSEASDKTPKIFGFVQASYAKDFGDVQMRNGEHLSSFSLLGPNLSESSGFNIFRARLGVRGRADDDNLVNYFFLTEFGNNAITNPAGHRDAGTHLTDASVTLKHLPGAKLRVGIFKTPGSEEGLQSVFASPYIEFTTMTNQQLLERKVSHVGAAAPGGIIYTSTAVDEPAAAFRDMGAQLFDSFAIAPAWSLSYAYMRGNGSGLALRSSDVEKTDYGYLALQKSFEKGKGYYSESMKFYLWAQEGNRRIFSSSEGEINAKRKRYGAGVSYYQEGLRFEAEYMRASGMIFTGAKDSDADPLKEEWQFQFAASEQNRADGAYVNLQYELVPKKFELFGRYDYLNRMTNAPLQERRFKTTTLGCSYRFKGPTRIDLNYLFKEATAPGNPNAQRILESMGDRIALQLTAVF